jgi:hypothetical protein
MNLFSLNLTRFFFFLILWIQHLSAFGQQVLSGTVVDKETGKPIPFASVGVVGTSRGTSTNLNGEFSLSITQPALIKISCVGYESLSMKSDESPEVIELKPTTFLLNEVYVLAKKHSPAAIVRRALANIPRNYDRGGFLQKFFYRHYCKDDSVYGRLVEAFVDVWKHQGYRYPRKKAGDHEEIRVTHLRRSLDMTEMAQGHEPISVGNILQADLVGYQQAEEKPYLSFFDEVSNLKIDLEDYHFELEGITSHDRRAVYKVNYTFKTDSILTTSGYVPAPKASGTLYIAVDSYAIVKAEEIKTDGNNVIRTSAYYQKQGDKYYPYHLVRTGEYRFNDNHWHTVHIELMSVDIRHGENERFTGQIPGKEKLLSIPYDSIYWSTNTILKTTPLEDAIINDLGGGSSLNRQFYRYQKYEWSISDGGNDGEAKLNWLLEDSKGKRHLYLFTWNENFDSYLYELEQFKKLNKRFRGRVSFILISLDNNPARWQQTLTRYSLFVDGIINYRLNHRSERMRHIKLTDTPGFYLLTKDGNIKGNLRPSDPATAEYLEQLLNLP